MALGYDKRQTLTYFSKYGKRNERTDFHERLLTKKVKVIADMNGDKLVLDVGCGFGRYADRYRDICTVIGLDLSIYMVRIAKRRLNDNLVRGDALRLPFRDNCFDITLAHGVSTILHNKTALITIKEMIRVTKKRGKFFIVRPSMRSFVSSLLKGKKPNIHYHFSFQLKNLISSFLNKNEIKSYGSNVISYRTSKVMNQNIMEYVDLKLGSIPLVKDFLCRQMIIVGERSLEN